MDFHVSRVSHAPSYPRPTVATSWRSSFAGAKELGVPPVVRIQCPPANRFSQEKALAKLSGGPESIAGNSSSLIHHRPAPSYRGAGKFGWSGRSNAAADEKAATFELQQGNPDDQNPGVASPPDSDSAGGSVGGNWYDQPQHGQSGKNNTKVQSQVKNQTKVQAEPSSSTEIENAWWKQYQDSSMSGTYSDETMSSYESDEVDMEEGGASSAGALREGSGWSTVSAPNKATYEVLKMDAVGNYRLVHVRRRDLLREHRIQPRDLRRIDPSVDFNKTSPSITIKENVLLICIGGVRAIATAYKALLFEPSAPATRKFFDIVVPHLRARGESSNAQPVASPLKDFGVSHSEYMSRYYGHKDPNEMRTPPFEMEVLEGALLVATGQLDMEMALVTKRVESLLANLPRDINPVNLEELRRVKSALVELETKADTVRKILEELMDDDDELRELNLSSRPRREERQKQRERKKLERELQRAQELKEEIEEHLDGDGPSSSSSSASGGGVHGYHGYSSSARRSSGSSVRDGASRRSSSGHDARSSSPYSYSPVAPWPSSASRLDSRQRTERIAELRSKYDRERLAELRSKFGLDRKDSSQDGGGNEERDSRRRGAGDDDQGWISRLEGSEEDIQEAQEALEEMVEQEEEEREIEEIEDLLEYYHQRAGGTQSEAEQLLEGARDLEESIGVSLSARRFEVNRLELTLSIGSFAAAIGAVVAGIFGMNMRSKLEESVGGFWGATVLIVLGCAYLFFTIMSYTRKKQIL